MKKRYTHKELEKAKIKRENKEQLKKIGYIILGIAIGVFIMLLIDAYIDFMNAYWDYIQLPENFRAF